MADYSRPVTPENTVNGTNGVPSPRTPKRTGLALTEYTANPSPSNEERGEIGYHGHIPDAFLLPTGYPDVRLRLFTSAYQFQV